MSATHSPGAHGASLDLTALDLPSDAAAPSHAIEVPIECVYEDPNNPRTEFQAQELEVLAQDIAQRGVLQPIVVWPSDAVGYRIRYGARRRRAAALAGLSTVPIVVNDRLDLDDYAQVAENLHRARLSPMDLARFIERKRRHGHSAADIARLLSVDKATITHHLALLDHPPAIAALYEHGRCTSARTLYELRNLHRVAPQTVVEFIAATPDLTRAAVRALARTVASAADASSDLHSKSESPDVAPASAALTAHDPDSFALANLSSSGIGAFNERKTGEGGVGPSNTSAVCVSRRADRSFRPQLMAEHEGCRVEVLLSKRPPSSQQVYVRCGLSGVEVLVPLSELTAWQLLDASAP